MSKAQRKDRNDRKDTPSPALHGAGGHDLIRVQGARVNNLKDVSVELPKRSLTVSGGDRQRLKLATPM
jgi:hypothetical protein